MYTCVTFDCTLFPDLRPHNLFHLLVPNVHYLPPGLELIYDDKHGVHGFRFTPSGSILSFPASALFTFCDSFPEEFSLLVTLKPSKRSRTRDETLFALIPRGSTGSKIGLRLQRGIIQVDYYDRLAHTTRVTEFKKEPMLDTDWHSIIIAVAGEFIFLRVDCDATRRRRLRRQFPSHISTRGMNIHLGNNNRGDGLFTVIMIICPIIGTRRNAL